jgi:hypothetical protein
MTPYGHVLTLLSFVYALALTHLLSRLGALLLARRRVRWSALQALAMLNAVAQVYLNWLVSWDTHNVGEWGLLSITVSFVFAVTNFLFCAAAAPDGLGDHDGEIDLDAFYFHNRRLYWGMLALMMAVALVANVAILNALPNLFWTSIVGTLPFFAPAALGFFVRARWAQWVSALGLLALSVAWSLVFTGTLVP